MFLRLLNAAFVTVSMSLCAFSQLNRKDCVFVVTNPPFLPFAIRLVCFLKRAKFVLIVHDVYPEAIVAAQLGRASNWFIWICSVITNLLYRHANAIITLGRDMQSLVKSKLRVSEVPTYIITNWSDVDSVKPESRESNTLLQQHNISDKFIVQYAGNMGKTHDLRSILEAAKIAEIKAPHVQFLFVGSGAQRHWIERQCEECCLQNVTLLDPQPRSSQNIFLNACDVAIISFVKGMRGVSVPSRLYNIMASGKPIIAMADPQSELSLVVSEENIGWIVNPGNVTALVETIVLASSCRDLRIMGERARAAAETKYNFSRIHAAYEQCVETLIGQTPLGQIR